MVSNAERQLKLLFFIQEHAPVSRETIFRELHEYSVSENTSQQKHKRTSESMRRKFIRDKEELEKCGFFIECDSDGLYSVNTDASYTIPIELSDAQASLLRYACCALLEDPTYLFKSELRTALIKISNELDAPDMLPFIDKNTNPLPDKSNSNFTRIFNAISKCKSISFDYTDAKGATSRREVNPHGAYTLERYFYLVAFDKDRKDMRCFRFDRIEKVRELNNAKTPDFDIQDFDINEWILLPFQIGDELFEAQINFTKDNAWHAKRLAKKHGTLVRNDDETYTWFVQANSTSLLASWCISNGPGIKPVKPENAVKRYRSSLEKLLEQTK